MVRITQIIRPSLRSLIVGSCAQLTWGFSGQGTRRPGPSSGSTLIESFEEFGSVRMLSNRRNDTSQPLSNR
jgi:hypothetical protein